MYYVTKEFSFCASHRLEGHEKCGRMHGHNYRLEVTICAEGLHGGMVIDFNKLDELVKPVIDMLDHRYIVSATNVGYVPEDAIQLPIQYSTAECLCSWFAHQLSQFLDEMIFIHEVTLWETPKCRATYRLC